MAELGMIDTMGYGIYQMHIGQARRYFPMPDYDLSEANVTRMTLYGGVIDQAYSEMLMLKTNLPLADILALDRVQKKLTVDDEMTKHLTMLRYIHDLVHDGSPFIIATHSPILWVYPNAKIYLFDARGISETCYEDTAHFALTRDFLNHHTHCVKRLLESP
jgi:hypothetical protein